MCIFINTVFEQMLFQIPVKRERREDQRLASREMLHMCVYT